MAQEPNARHLRSDRERFLYIALGENTGCSPGMGGVPRDSACRSVPSGACVLLGAGHEEVRFFVEGFLALDRLKKTATAEICSLRNQLPPASGQTVTFPDACLRQTHGLQHHPASHL